MISYVIVLLSALVAAWLLTPVARRTALAIGVVDRPDIRKQHRKPIPYLGGVAVFGGLLAGLAMLFLVARDPLRSLQALDGRTLAMVLGSFAMFTVGLLDDLHNLRARHKLAVQLLVATGMWFAGIRLEAIHLTDSITLEFGMFSLPLTVLWIAGVTNAFNVIDGLDGLASGLGAISATGIAIVAYNAGNYPVAALLVILCGALLGFLPHNRHPARIFLGDAGSLLVGFLLATAAASSNSKSTAFVAVGAPFLALALPILDLSFACLRRFIERRSLFAADRNHIHHRLLARGFGHKRTVQILWAESAATTGLALLLLYFGTESWQRIAAFAAVLAGHIVFFRATGAVRLRESLWAFRSAAERLRNSSLHQKHFDELDLHFRSVRDLHDWWQAVSLAADRLGVTGLRLRMPQSNEATLLTWHRPMPAPGAHMLANLPLRLPDGDGVATLELELSASSIELSGQILEVLGRLLDRHGLESVPRLNGSGQGFAVLMRETVQRLLQRPRPTVSADPGLIDTERTQQPTAMR